MVRVRHLDIIIRAPWPRPELPRNRELSLWTDTTHHCVAYTGHSIASDTSGDTETVPWNPRGMAEFQCGVLDVLLIQHQMSDLWEKLADAREREEKGKSGRISDPGRPPPHLLRAY